MIPEKVLFLKKSGVAQYLPCARHCASQDLWGLILLCEMQSHWSSRHPPGAVPHNPSHVGEM